MEKETRFTGLGFADALTLLFIGLKLTGYIDWPWMIVLCPLWIVGGLVLVLTALTLLIVKIRSRKY